MEGITIRYLYPFRTRRERGVVYVVSIRRGRRKELSAGEYILRWLREQLPQ